MDTHSIPMPTPAGGEDRNKQLQTLQMDLKNILIQHPGVTFHTHGVPVHQKPDFFFPCLFFPVSDALHSSLLIHHLPTRCWNLYFRISWAHDRTSFSGPERAAQLLLLEM